MGKRFFLYIVQSILFFASLFTISSALTLTSSAFRHGQPLPQQYTCMGYGMIPPLAWKQIPTGTQSFVIIIDDPDAPRGLFTHWIYFNLPGTLIALPTPNKLLTVGEAGSNSSGNASYFPPCPPVGSGVHHYIFQLYALNRTLALPYNAKRVEVESAMHGHILATASLMGTVAR